jgi:photosystem II stability/assembly factor-like uncharacterized protein
MGGIMVQKDSSYQYFKFFLGDYTAGSPSILSRTEQGGRGWGREQGGEMTQTMYVHVNKRIKKKNRTSAES